MNSGLMKLGYKVAANPEKTIRMIVRFVEYVPEVIPLAAIGAAGYGIYKLTTRKKKGEKASAGKPGGAKAGFQSP